MKLGRIIYKNKRQVPFGYGCYRLIRMKVTENLFFFFNLLDGNPRFSREKMNNELIEIVSHNCEFLFISVKPLTEKMQLSSVYMQLLLITVCCSFKPPDVEKQPILTLFERIIISGEKPLKCRKS